MGRHAEKQPAYKVATEVKKGKAVRARYPTIKLLRKASFGWQRVGAARTVTAAFSS
jgi:hypothetical protein